ncbi:hypothetical protein P3X46_031370 [Hevea brasiliensis]|uniref:Protein kinase domain-containing protein n=1 Tax=Hevea brasiliensis TaxID=3981 RepID=A0ABQ9KLS7_HEVBR|nr:hypothetical protein P3X46_031370 [Hevea brasiliensis]
MWTQAPKSCILSALAIISLIISTFPSHIRSQNNASDYDLCSPFKCGNSTFSFPFSNVSGPRSCGLPGYHCTCYDEQSPGIIFSGKFFSVKGFYLSDRLITVVDTQLITQLTAGHCTSLNNLTIFSDYIAPLSLLPGTFNLTLISCPGPSREFLDKMVSNYTLGSSKKNWKKLGFILGVSIGSCFILLIIVLLVLAFRKRILPSFKMNNQSTEDRKNVEQFVKTYQSSLITNFSYSDIKKMTNGFREKLGEGGYGNVYKGRLLSAGRLVAVKLLQNSNNNGSDFVNEVATIGMIRHVNVIRLLGFSWNGSKQAVIYEYMPNGSLGDLLTNERLRLSLGSARMLEIATGIALGIEYLHNGCESRILHLDIKPQNVLLDENFNPKISDFGLAKIYSRSRSAVTMTCVRGTIGYIAPEIFMRKLGKPSHKSDVYSYGMLLLEMAGTKNTAELNLKSSSSEAYFPGWIHDLLVEGIQGNGRDQIELVVEDACILRKMVMVGLWCVQINPKDRPSMKRVVEMLSGNVDVIEMPPKPLFLSSRHHDSQHQIDIAFAESDTRADSH